MEDFAACSLQFLTHRCQAHGLADLLQQWRAYGFSEFLDLYEQGGLNDDDRFTLMALIVSSFDDWLSGGGTDEALSQRLRQHLVNNFTLHAATIRYWSQLVEPDLDNVFSATPFMREIWKQSK